MRISYNGKVGIGTTLPDEMLHISQGTDVLGTNIKLENTDVSLGSDQVIGSVIFKSNDASTGGTGVSGYIKNVSASNGVVTYLDFGTREGATGEADSKMIIYGNGDVMFGDGGAPQARLQVFKSEAEAQLKIQGGLSTNLAVGEVNSSILFGANDPSVNGTGIGDFKVAGKIASVTEHSGGAMVGLAFYTFNQSRASADRLQLGMQLDAYGTLDVVQSINTGGYTVSTLPTGKQGDRAYVTDATTPTYLGTLTGGGAVVCPVFYNGTAWVSA